LVKNKREKRGGGVVVFFSLKRSPEVFMNLQQLRHVGIVLHVDDFNPTIDCNDENHR
jgi:hypothetical protein